MADNPTAHHWRFFRTGGFDQVRLDRGSDLQHLGTLDQKLWAALSCPTTGLEFDARTLALIDADSDGRIRAPDLVAATEWACHRLKDANVLADGGKTLRLDDIDDSTDAGHTLKASARQILANLGKASASELTLADIADRAQIFAQTRFNGDGVIPADVTSDPDLTDVISDILNTCGSETDRSGKPGIAQAQLARFFTECEMLLEWWHTPQRLLASEFPPGSDIAAALRSFNAVQDKIDDYFARVQLAEFDPRTLEAIERHEEAMLADAAHDTAITPAEIAVFPLNRIIPGKSLSLVDNVNPAWLEALSVFRELVVHPLLGKLDTLDNRQWREISARLANCASWQAAKPETVVEPLGIERLEAIRQASPQAALQQLIDEDLRCKAEADGIDEVERLLHYRCYLHSLLNNVVSFRDFYTGRQRAIFQAGTLYIDGRSCDLCLHVDDPERHATLATLAKTFLAYCECVRGDQRQYIVAAITNGSSDQLIIGRNGVFYDTDGNDWDATIVKIIDHPISIRQAFWAPYRKLGRTIEEQVAKRASATGKSSAALPVVAETPATKTADGRKVDVGTVAAIGVAMGSIGTFLAAVFAKFIELGWWIPVAMIALVLVISLPAMVIAWMKLRERNLGPILDASGWAVNTRAKMNVPFGSALTRLARLPANAERTLSDPYQPKKPWGLLSLSLLIICSALAIWAALHFGWLQVFLKQAGF